MATSLQAAQQRKALVDLAVKTATIVSAAPEEIQPMATQMFVESIFGYILRELAPLYLRQSESVVFVVVEGS